MIGVTNKFGKVSYAYYTEIKTKINHNIFNKYSSKVSSIDMSENTANMMIALEDMILSSEAYKSQGNKQTVNTDKWQTYKTKKAPLMDLFFCLNKLSENNIISSVEEAFKYTNLSIKDTNQLADIYLGKCIMEQQNIEIFIMFFKMILSKGCWNVICQEQKNEGIQIVSFREIMMDRLQNEYIRLIKIASHIEDMFKNQLRENGEIGSREGSDEYIKKKTIIISLINLIGELFNNKIISSTLLFNIMEHLKHNYMINPIFRKIYIELLLILWDKTVINIYMTYKEQYDEYQCFFAELINNINCERINFMIESSMKYIENLKTNKKMIKEIFTNIKRALNYYNKHNLDMNKNNILFFKNEINETIKEDIIIEYLMHSSNENANLNENMDIIMNFIDEIKLKYYIKNALLDDDLICDFPKFKRYVKDYII